MSSQLTVNPDSLIDEIQGDLEPLLRESGITFNRLRSTFIIAVQNNPDILKCSAASIQREITKCAIDGLMPDGKEAAMIPYKGELQYTPMKNGIIRKLKESGTVFMTTCNLVYENDPFELDEANPESLRHPTDKTRFSNNRGPLIGGYALFRDEQMKIMHAEFMSKADFDRVRAASKAQNSPAWVNWYDMMCIKALIRRGSNSVPVRSEKMRTILERDDDMFDFQRGAGPEERVNPFGGQTIDGSVAADQHKAHDSREDRTQKADNAHHKAEGKTEKKEPKPLPDTPPEFADVLPKDEDISTLAEVSTKILNVALEPIAPDARKDILFDNAANWKDALPEYAHDFAKGCIAIANWSIRRDAEGKAWQSEHALYAHKVKEALGVEKLALSKYPEGAK